MLKQKFPDEIKGGELLLKKPAAEIEHAQDMFQLVSRNNYFYPWRFSLSSLTSAEAAMRLIGKRIVAFDAMTDVYYDIFLQGTYVGEVYGRDIEYETGIIRNLGYFVDGAQQCKGIASSAVNLLGDYLFSVGAHRINLFCHFFGELKNHASEKVAKKCGYTFEGTGRQVIYDPIGKRWADEHMFAKLEIDQ